MWFFKKKKSWAESGLFVNRGDFHSHILPSVDDGVETEEESLSILSSYEQLGIQQVWLTPHIMEDIPNETSFLKSSFEKFQKAYHGGISLHLSAEYMLDNLFDERLVKEDLLPIGEARMHLLVEMSYFNPSMNYLQTLGKIQNKGYHPLLAHPERYIYMDRRDYALLKSNGICFQLNFFSLLGFYGKEVKEKAFYLLKKGMYDTLGSDVHRATMIDLLQNKMDDKLLPFLQALFEKDEV
ncbi:MAG TPA: capsular biosynthesis protein [Porphyromonadaceae bacterium]|nr:capsular biosynthesis protein [Porphyromonadaceae bacterium]